MQLLQTSLLYLLSLCSRSGDQKHTSCLHQVIPEIVSWLSYTCGHPLILTLLAMGAFADPSTGLFHQAYLYTPFNVTGRNAGAGATTADFVTWTDLTPDDPSFIRSGGKNDELAVFDGTVIPSGVDGLPTLIYTSVAYLPISWTVPYVPGSETQSIAVSNDSGVTFNKLEQGPVLASAPFGVDPIGWRDPFMFQNPQFDSLLNSTDGVWYCEQKY